MISFSRQTLLSLLEAYRRKHDLKPGSYAQLMFTVAATTRWERVGFDGELLKPAGVPLEFSSCDDETLCDYLHWQRETRSLAPKTVNRQRGDLITLLRYARRQGWIAWDPNPREIVRFKETKRNPTAWTQDELAKLFAAIAAYRPARPLPGWDNRHWRAIALVIYYTAYRFQACLLLEKSQLRADGAIIALAETQKTFCDDIGWLGADAMEAIATLPDNGSTLLFAFPREKQAFWYHWKRILKLAGLPATRRDGPQKMRRTSATYVEAAQPGAAMRHLGHKTHGLAETSYIDRTIATLPKASTLLPRIGRSQSKMF